MPNANPLGFSAGAGTSANNYGVGALTADDADKAAKNAAALATRWNPRLIPGTGNIAYDTVDAAGNNQGTAVGNATGFVKPLGQAGASATPRAQTTRPSTDPSKLPAPAADPASAVVKPGSTGITFNGQKLPYGAMVNGVPTFSDGSNGIARTMTDDQIKNLGSRLNIATAPLEPLASDTLGYTPSNDQMVSQRMAQLQRFQPVTGSRPSATDFAQAERDAVASGDWRSAAGTVAHNLDIDAQYGGAAGKTKAMLGRQALFAGINQGETAADQQAARTQQAGDAMDLENLRGQWGMADTTQKARLAQLTRTGKPVTLADGTMGLQDPITGVVTPSTMADGTVARALVDKKAQEPIYASTGGQRMLQQMTNNILGVDPLTGMVKDPNAPGGTRLPTNAESYAAMQKAMGQMRSLNGGAATPAPAAAKPTLQQFLTAARARNPGTSDADLTTYYNRTYGAKQ